MWQNLGRHIADAFGRLSEAFLSVIPALFVLFVSLLVGLAVGLAVRAVLRLLFRLSRFERHGGSAGPDPFLRAAGGRTGPAELAGTLSFWAAILVALAVGVNALEPGSLKSTLNAAVLFLPRLLT